MTVSLSKEDAARLLAKVEDARGVAVNKLTQMRDTQDGMLQQNWQGNSATHYSSTSAQQFEDFTQIITNLNMIVEKGSTHIHRITNQDNG